MGDNGLAAGTVQLYHPRADSQALFYTWYLPIGGASEMAKTIMRAREPCHGISKKRALKSYHLR